MKIIKALVLAVFPTSLARYLLSYLGWKIEGGVKVGFSWISCDDLNMLHGSRIGHFNYISGPFDLIMSKSAQIGNFNRISRGKLGVAVGRSCLYLGNFSKITSRHLVDLTCPIEIGDYSIVSGSRSQIWTHGYVHEEEGLDRYRIDGSVEVGDNVYIGSMCFISMGVTIADKVIVGGGSCVAKDLSEPGMYVSAGLRQLPRPSDPDSRENLEPVDRALVCERVYRKRRP